MMNQSTTNACAIARKMFMAQTTGLEGLVLNINDPTQLVIMITENGVTQNCASATVVAAAALARVVTVSYYGQSTNDFATILGINTLSIHGTSQSNAAVAPNIDFYMMLDTSPSMLLPATSAGLAQMVALTPTQGDVTPKGCAFACHQIDTRPSVSSDIQGNPIDPTDTTNPANNKRRLDNYTLARNAGIILRTDLVSSAVQDLTTVATNTATLNHATYRMGLADFDHIYRQLWPTTANSGFWVDSNLSTVSTHVADAQVLQYCHNNQLVCNTTSPDDGDTGTNYTTALAGSLGTMPALAGTGAHTPGATPQAILFIITDGMRDENNSGRKLGPLPTAQCDTIKNRGIRIAILYTQYLPSSASDSWSISNVKTPYLTPTDKISPPLISCASPGLYYQVTTDSDISAALTALFQAAVATARLTQ
jgi:hypothetical protein